MADFKKLEQNLKAVSSHRRLRILSLIKKHKHLTVTDLSEILPIRKFPISQHLRILRNAGIVTYTKRGRYVSYRLSLKQEEPIKKILSLL